MSKKISEVLQEAQNLLGEGYRDAEFICHAIAIAMGNPRDLNMGAKSPAGLFLQSLGMPTSGAGFSSYTRNDAIVHDKDYLHDDTSQALRYAWLELAIQVAEEEGL